MHDLTLSSSWIISLHDPSSHCPCTKFGEFNTIFTFWQLFNLLIEKNLLNTNEPLVNITIYRKNVALRPNYTKQWHGEWNIELNHMTFPIKIFQQIVLLVIGEQLTDKIRGIVLQRTRSKNNNKINYSISIFTEMTDNNLQQPNPSLNVKNILLSNNVIDLNHCVNKLIIFHPFQIIHIPIDHRPDINININNNNNNHQQIEEKQIEEEEEEEQEEEEEEEDVSYIKYSMDSLMEYSKLIESQCILPNFKYRDYVINGFGKFLDLYNFKLVKRDDIFCEKLDVILSSEGCAICMQTTLKSPYRNRNNKECKFEEEKEKEVEKDKDIMINNNNDDRYSFIVARCSSFGCQHIMHNQCIINAFDNIIIRGKHCCTFFETMDISHLTNREIQREFGYHINKDDVTQNIYHFSFKINHLISNQNCVSPQWPIIIPSYYQINQETNQKQECLQIFFDNTKLEVFKGTIQIAIITDDGININNINNNKHIKNNIGDIFMANANFEIPFPFITNEENKKILKNAKDTDKIYQLQHIDPISGNKLIVNVNMKLKPSFELQLISLRYEFNQQQPMISDCISEISGVTKLIDSLPSPSPIIPSPIIPSPSPSPSPSPIISTCCYPSNISNIIYNDTTFNLNLYNNPQQLFCYACSAIGSNYISHRVKDPIYFSLFFQKLSKFFPSLMINSVGHTICRALYGQSHCGLSNKLFLLNCLLPQFSKIAANRQGSFAIICIMSLMTTTQEIQVLTNAFISAINTNINIINHNHNHNHNDDDECKDNDDDNNDDHTAFDEIISSQSGYHVIKKFISFGYPHFDCIIKGLCKDFKKYATHHYGVPIIRSIFDMISNNNDLINKYEDILTLFVQDTELLICNEYGNYVIQQLLQISTKNVTNIIKQFMLTKYSEYSKHKFASNVVEKCLKHSLNEIKKNDNKICDENWIELIVRELLSNASELINHKFGNYCLQTALSVVTELCDSTKKEEKKHENNDDKKNHDYMLLLNEFIHTTYPLLHLLRINVKKKWQQLLISAKRKNKFYNDYNYY